MDDGELLRLLQGPGGPVRDQAISELRAVLLRGLSKGLNHRYGKPFQAEDIVQDALMKVLNSLNHFQGRSKFTTWAMTIAMRLGIRELRRRHYQDVSMEVFQEGEGLAMQIAVVDEPILANSEDRTRILETLRGVIDGELTDKQRRVTHAFLSGFATDEIAERMSMNRNAVYKLIHDARQKIKDGFTRAGMTGPEILEAMSQGVR